MNTLPEHQGHLACYLWLQVYRTSPAQMSGQHRYGVRIISSLVEYDVDVASSFIALGHALLSTDKLEVSWLSIELLGIYAAIMAYCNVQLRKAVALRWKINKLK